MKTIIKKEKHRVYVPLTVECQVTYEIFDAFDQVWEIEELQILNVEPPDEEDLWEATMNSACELAGDEISTLELPEE